MYSKKIIKSFINPNIIPVILFILFPLTSFFGLLFLLAVSLPTLIRAGKTIAKLERNGELDKAAAELISPNSKKFVNQKLVLTDNYVFCKKTGYVFSYDEILWAYKNRHTTTLFFIPIKVTDSLYVATNGVKPRMIASMGKDKTEEIKNAILEIYTHNNNCLIGYTNENLQKYKALAHK